MSADTRLKLGVALLIVGLIMPAGTLPVAATDWPLAVKTVGSTILLLGFEIMLIPAVALMGKDNFDRIWAAAMRLSRRSSRQAASAEGDTRLVSICWWAPHFMPGLRATLGPGSLRTMSCGFGSIWGSTRLPLRACSC
jgi:hypothetical protein